MLRQSRILPWLALIATLSLATGRAHAQCTITGPASMCGSPVTLCAPDGGELYEWTLPDGSHQWDQCVTASMPGTYSVRLFDPHLNDWTSPCTHELAGSGGAPGISGPASGCTGASVELCGPVGSFEYEWTGPSGFASGEACAVVSEAGTYQLRVRPVPDGCWSEWASREVAFSTCGDPPPPPDPDPTPSLENCPRPAWWWAQQCPDHDRSGVRLDPGLMARISDCVRDHDGGGDGSFCRTMLAGHRTLAMRASRQVAAVWANLCAGEMGVRSRDGRHVSLDPTTAVSVGDYHGTVGSWLGSASATLAAMGGSNRSKSEREEYRRIIRVAWHINHGLGIGRACSETGDAPAGGVSLAYESNAMSTTVDPEPLAAELMDDSPSALAFAMVENPARGRMAMAYAVQTETASDVTIGVYDVSGRLVRELVRGSVAPGSYSVQWDGKDQHGVAVRGGMYFVLGRAGGQLTQTRVTMVR